MAFKLSEFFIALTLISVTYQLDMKSETNGTCYSDDGISRYCSRLDRCPEGIDAIKSGIPPKICGFESSHPLVCCPSENILQSTTNKPALHELTTLGIRRTTAKYRDYFAVAKQKCKEYSKSIIIEIDSPNPVDGTSDKQQIDTCARVEEALILGGENAKPREYPHMALIGYGETNPDWLCGGSLISEQFVLSAAHCTRSLRKGLARWIKIGDLDTSTDNDDAEPHLFRIIERIDHPQHDPVTLYNDIALYKLDEEVRIGPYIRPICLHTRHDIVPRQAIATGWGHTEWEGEEIVTSKPQSITVENISTEEILPNLTSIINIRSNHRPHFDFERGTASSHLMKVKLNMVTNEDCNESYESSVGKHIPNGILEDAMLCAGKQNGKDTCQGDSGGPLQIPIKEPYCMYAIIGVTSFGKKCGSGTPGVYTRVSHYLPWIVQNVWPV